MIMGLPEKLRRRWDILLPCLLFAYREVPQKGVGFSPFELLFGHPVRGPLTLVKEGWEQPLKAPKQDIVDYVLGLRSRMAEYMKKASKNLQASQELQKQWHDQKAVLVQYQPGQKVWVLEPVAPRALQDKWSGPHTIVEKKGEVTYLVDLGTARSPLRVLHVNRLKPYYDRADLTLLMATDEGQEEDSDPLPDLFSSTEQDALVEGVVLADCLTAEQKDNCINLLDQFSELFSTVPGGTRRSQIGPAERGDVEQDKEPSLKQVAPGEVPEPGTKRMRETVLAEVAQRSPTSPETNLESRAMQVRVPWTQAWLCTKDFRRKCTGAGVAAKVAVPSNAAQRGAARTYLHQTWTEESLDCGGHLDRVVGFEGPRSSC
ncbi:hypothetical protein NDU88_005007 [Pleurodeles waltl]|uniref:Integrase p58-like C-terminal domain-containing protein n=1 Tax=Pleurodeles waltl TaxID=8319 RepID=A0AAV7PEP7_PLEWA|nr:hypothetical protein NDU88_005005 [Pleurodeles waltl]KAJ1126600.1 hypothetical protein NDU88_005007 [Pleurodeles waltl]